MPLKLWLITISVFIKEKYKDGVQCMKIGIITFHWATNYGAVMQSYALSKYLSSQGHNVQIINYYPKRFKKNIINALKTRHISVIPKKLKEILKEKNIMQFRKKHLKLTEYFKSNDELRNAELDFDCYICGSDQIWNESFLRSGERKKTYSYFLDFAKDNKIIASYAASFGATKYKDDLKADILKYLKRFDFISVRENTGLDILNDIGINNVCVVPDPAMLLKKADYKKLIGNNQRVSDYAFVYMLHNRYSDARDLVKYIKNKGEKIVKCKGIGVEEWLSNIYYAKHIITNSFHGVLFSIIFRKPFTAILIDGSGMNDRMMTLLEYLDLQDRIYQGEAIIVEKSINWEAVSKKLTQYRNVGYNYIKDILNYKKEMKK